MLPLSLVKLKPVQEGVQHSGGGLAGGDYFEELCKRAIQLKEDGD